MSKVIGNGKKPRKVFVDVIADCLPNGDVRPINFVFQDERYEIQRLIRVTKMATAKTGGADEKYVVIIEGQLHEIFFTRSDTYTDTHQWYILIPSVYE